MGQVVAKDPKLIFVPDLLGMTLKVMQILDVNSLFPSLKEHVLNITPVISEI